MILGMQWLESLGSMQVNWRTLTMPLKLGGISVLLQGDPSLSNSLISLKVMWKAIRDQGEGVLVELGCIGVIEKGIGDKVPPKLKKC